MVESVLDAGSMAQMQNLQNHAAQNEGNAESFAQTLEDFLYQTKQIEQEANQGAQEFAAGSEDRNLHQVMIDLKKADTSLRVMSTMQNEAVQAYEEIMRMQV